MHGTTTTKVGRLVTDLLRHPQYIPRYFSDHVRRRRSPLDLEIPWFSYAAIEFLEEWLQPNMAVAEYGSGGSTLFFARRVKSVLSIEDNLEWKERVTRCLQDAGLRNVEIRWRPFDFRNPLGFEQSPYLRALPDDRPFDLVVIDGTEEWTKVRPTCFRYAQERIREGGVIVVDDSWRYPQLRREHTAKSVRRFQSVGPGRPGVTTTDAFFY
jgi:predicted O-methyltransferase YrrM